MRSRGAGLTLGALLASMALLVIWLGPTTNDAPDGGVPGAAVLEASRTGSLPTASPTRASPAPQVLALPTRQETAARTPAPSVTGRVAGRVLTLDGHPVAEACVQLELSGRRLLDWSDRDGRFAFDDIPAGPLQLRASSLGYRLSSTTALTADDPGPHLLHLERDTGLCGQLLSSSGDPASGPVVIRSVGGDVRAQTVADDLGRFCVGDLDPGSYEVTAVSGAGLRIDLARGSLAELTLVLDHVPAAPEADSLYETLRKAHAAGLIGPGDIY